MSYIFPAQRGTALATINVTDSVIARSHRSIAGLALDDIYAKAGGSKYLCEP